MRDLFGQIHDIFYRSLSIRWMKKSLKYFPRIKIADERADYYESKIHSDSWHSPEWIKRRTELEKQAKAKSK